MEKLREIILQRKRQRKAAVPPEEEQDSEKRTKTEEKPVDRLFEMLKSRKVTQLGTRPKKSLLGIFDEEAGGEYEMIYTDSVYMREARDLDTVESQGKIWKKGKYTHPFFEEANELTRPEKNFIVHKWMKTLFSEWESHSQAERLLKYSEYFAESKSLAASLLTAVKQNYLSKDSLDYLFVITRFSQIKSYSRANYYHLKLSSEFNWSVEGVNSNLLTQETQRLYSQIIRRLLAISQLVHND